MSNLYPDPRLSKLLILLSLDGVVPLYEDMGLRVEDKEGFLRVLRETILENRRIWESGARQPPALRALLLRNLHARLGPGAAREFSRWAETAFAGVHAEQPQWSAWEIVFSNWTYNEQTKLKGLAEERRKALLASYVEKTSIGDVKAKIDELKSQPLSEWDLDIYARHNYGVDEFSDPYIILRLMIAVHRLQNFWCEVGPGLTEEEKAVLLEEGEEVIGRLGVWMPGPLQSLDELGEEVC